MYYAYKIVYLEDGVLKTYTEKRAFPFIDQAYAWFERLCEKHNVGPYRYLCSWE